MLKKPNVQQNVDGKISQNRLNKWYNIAREHLEKRGNLAK